MNNQIITDFNPNGLYLERLGNQSEYREIVFSQEESRIGRAINMEICIEKGRTVSREHSRILFIEGRMYIENMSKTNFTFLNDDKVVQRTEVEVGDIVGLGATSDMKTSDKITEDQKFLYLCKMRLQKETNVVKKESDIEVIVLSDDDNEDIPNQREAQITDGGDLNKNNNKSGISNQNITTVPYKEPKILDEKLHSLESRVVLKRLTLDEIAKYKRALSTIPNSDSDSQQNCSNFNAKKSTFSRENETSRKTKDSMSCNNNKKKEKNDSTFYESTNLIRSEFERRVASQKIVEKIKSITDKDDSESDSSNSKKKNSNASKVKSVPSPSASHKRRMSFTSESTKKKFRTSTSDSDSNKKVQKDLSNEARQHRKADIESQLELKQSISNNSSSKVNFPSISSLHPRPPVIDAMIMKHSTNSEKSKSSVKYRNQNCRQSTSKDSTSTSNSPKMYEVDMFTKVTTMRKERLEIFKQKQEIVVTAVANNTLCFKKRRMSCIGNEHTLQSQSKQSEIKTTAKEQEVESNTYVPSKPKASAPLKVKVTDKNRGDYLTMSVVTPPRRLSVAQRSNDEQTKVKPQSPSSFSVSLFRSKYINKEVESKAQLSMNLNDAINANLQSTHRKLSNEQPNSESKAETNNEQENTALAPTQIAQESSTKDSVGFYKTLSTHSKPILKNVEKVNNDRERKSVSFKDDGLVSVQEISKQNDSVVKRTDSNQGTGAALPNVLKRFSTNAAFEEIIDKVLLWESKWIENFDLAKKEDPTKWCWSKIELVYSDPDKYIECLRKITEFELIKKMSLNWRNKSSDPFEFLTITNRTINNNRMKLVLKLCDASKSEFFVTGHLLLLKMKDNSLDSPKNIDFFGYVTHSEKDEIYVETLHKNISAEKAVIKAKSIIYLRTEVFPMISLKKLPESSILPNILNPYCNYLTQPQSNDDNEKITDLSPEQDKIIKQLMRESLDDVTKKIFVLNGGPGVGKTRLMIELILQMLKNSTSQKSFLICARSNATIDYISTLFLKHKDSNVNVVRMGNTIKMIDIVRPLSLHEQAQAMKKTNPQIKRSDAEKEIIRRSNVVLTTTISSNRLNDFKKDFEMCFVDGANNITDSELIVPGLLSFKKLVLIGDDKQNFRLNSSNLPLFTRIMLFFEKVDDVQKPIFTLSTQHRLQNEIFHFCNKHWYANEMKQNTQSSNRILKPYKIFALNTDDCDLGTSCSRKMTDAVIKLCSKLPNDYFTCVFASGQSQRDSIMAEKQFNKDRTMVFPLDFSFNIETDITVLVIMKKDLPTLDLLSVLLTRAKVAVYILIDYSIVAYSLWNDSLKAFYEKAEKNKNYHFYEPNTDVVSEIHAKQDEPQEIEE